MKRYATFVARFALAPMISGTFVVSTNGRASLIEWAHIIAGYATIYLIIGLLLRSAKYRELRIPAAVALVLALLEAIPGMPRFHAAVSPLLFAALVWTASVRAATWIEPARGWRIFLLPALVLPPILYGVGYRHQTSGFVPHVGAAMLAAGVLLVFSVAVNEKYPNDAPLRGIARLTIAAVLFQLAAGFSALVIRLLEIDGGLALAMARTAHITGAAPVLAASTMLAIQYRRRAA